MILQCFANLKNKKTKTNSLNLQIYSIDLWLSVRVKSHQYMKKNVMKAEAGSSFVDAEKATSTTEFVLVEKTARSEPVQ